MKSDRKVPEKKSHKDRLEVHGTTERKNASMFEVNSNNLFQIPEQGKNQLESKHDFQDARISGGRESDHFESNKEIRGILKQSNFPIGGENLIGENSDQFEEDPAIKKTHS